MQSSRVSWIDIARGIGIIFVVYAHIIYTSGSNDYRYLFYAFHMPFFFFLSGIFFRESINFRQFAVKSAKNLLIPYLVLAFSMFGIWFLNILIYNLNVSSAEIVLQFLSIFYGNSNNGLKFNDVLWFLPTLFVTKILFAVITKIASKKSLILMIILSFSIFGYFFSIYAAGIKLPLGIETAFSAVVFYGLGYLWMKSKKAVSMILNFKYLFFPLLLILGWVAATTNYHLSGHQIDMRMNHLDNYFLFYTGAFAGIFAWIAFSMSLNRNSLLEYIGKNSLILFAWHPMVFRYFSVIFYFLSNFFISLNVRFLLPLIFTFVAISAILSVKLALVKIKKGIAGAFKI